MRVFFYLFFVIFLIAMQFVFLGRRVSPIYQGDEYAFLRLTQSFPNYDKALERDSGLQRGSVVSMGLISKALAPSTVRSSSTMMIIANHIAFCLSICVLALLAFQIWGRIDIVTVLLMTTAGFGVWKNAFMADTIYFLFVTISVVVTVYFRSRLVDILLLALTCVGAVTTKPHGLALFVSGSIFIWFFSNKKNWRGRLGQLGLYSFAFLLPWMLITRLLGAGTSGTLASASVGQIYLSLLSMIALKILNVTYLSNIVVNFAFSSFLSALLLGPLFLASKEQSPRKNEYVNGSRCFLLTFWVLTTLMASVFIVNEDATRIMGRYFSFMWIPTLILWPLSAKWSPSGWARRNKWSLVFGYISFYVLATFVKPFYIYPWDFPELFFFFQEGYRNLFLIVNPLTISLVSTFGNFRLGYLPMVIVCLCLVGGSVAAYRWQLNRDDELKVLKEIGMELNSYVKAHGDIAFIGDERFRYNEGAVVMYQLDRIPVFEFDMGDIKKGIRSGRYAPKWVCYSKEFEQDLFSGLTGGQYSYEKSPVVCRATSALVEGA